MGRAPPPPVAVRRIRGLRKTGHRGHRAGSFAPLTSWVEAPQKRPLLVPRPAASGDRRERESPLAAPRRKGAVTCTLQEEKEQSRARRPFYPRPTADVVPPFPDYRYLPLGSTPPHSPGCENVATAWCSHGLPSASLCGYLLLIFTALTRFFFVFFLLTLLGFSFFACVFFFRHKFFYGNSRRGRELDTV